MKKYMLIFLFVLLGIISLPFIAPAWIVIWAGNLIYWSGKGIARAGDFLTDNGLILLRYTGKPFRIVFKKLNEVKYE